MRTSPSARLSRVARGFDGGSLGSRKVKSRALLWIAFLLGLGACAGSIVKVEADRPLKPAEISKMLRSDDFRKKNRARAQISKLPEPERYSLLVELTHDEDPATRMLAVAELAKMSDPKAEAEITRLAGKDPDPDVRDLAQAIIDERTAARAPGAASPAASGMDAGVGPDASAAGAAPAAPSP